MDDEQQNVQACLTWLRDTICEKRLSGDYFSSETGVLALDEKLFNILSQQPDGWRKALNVRSVNYHEAAGNAYARWRKERYKLIWLTEALICAFTATIACDRLFQKLMQAEIKPTAYELDQRQSVLQRWPLRRAEALACIEQALMMPDVEADTRGRLLVGKATILARNIERNRKELFYGKDAAICVRWHMHMNGIIGEAMGYAKEASVAHPGQASHIYAECAHIFKIGGYEGEAYNAWYLAQELQKSIKV